MRTYNNIQEIIDHNFEAGQFYFSEGAMRFFNSVVAPTLYGEHQNIFITSEQFDEDTRRMYSVHLIDENGEVQDLSEFQQFKHIKQAKKFIANYLGEMVNA